MIDGSFVVFYDHNTRDSDRIESISVIQISNRKDQTVGRVEKIGYGRPCTCGSFASSFQRNSRNRRRCSWFRCYGHVYFVHVTLPYSKHFSSLPETVATNGAKKYDHFAVERLFWQKKKKKTSKNAFIHHKKKKQFLKQFPVRFNYN